VEVGGGRAWAGGAIGRGRSAEVDSRARGGEPLGEITIYQVYFPIINPTIYFYDFLFGEGA